jgi:hypothetical protein
MLVQYNNSFAISKKPWSVSKAHEVTTDVSMDYPPFIGDYKARVAQGLQGVGAIGPSNFFVPQVNQRGSMGSFLTPPGIRGLGTTTTSSSFGIDTTTSTIDTPIPFIGNIEYNNPLEWVIWGGVAISLATAKGIWKAIIPAGLLFARYELGQISF